LGEVLNKSLRNGTMWDEALRDAAFLVPPKAAPQSLNRRFPPSGNRTAAQMPDRADSGLIQGFLEL
jgi:hypothetical protein